MNDSPVRTQAVKIKKLSTTVRNHAITIIALRDSITTLTRKNVDLDRRINAFAKLPWYTRIWRVLGRSPTCITKL